MPTKTSVPVNFSDMSNTNITKIRSGAKWKGFGVTKSYECQTQNGFFIKNCESGATSGNKTKVFPKKYNIFFFLPLLLSESPIMLPTNMHATVHCRRRRIVHHC